MVRYKLILLFLFISVISKGQVYINEFMASNSGVIVDPDYQQSSDWVELYNSGSQPVQLNGYYLTDNISDPLKWQININAVIGSGKYLVIWADGLNTGLHTSFKLSATGEELALVSPQAEILDSLTFGNQELNISFGRKTDAANDWVYFTTPTPGAANSAITYNGVVKSDPSFSLPGGIYNGAVSVGLKSIFGGEVHYTLDGSEPSENSPLAGNPINVAKNTVIRARILKPGQLAGPVITHTYFIDTENKMNKLPVVSISSDPQNFWDATKGIYVQNFKPDWEIPINIELFENDGRKGDAFNVRAGLKINGLYSWQLPEKMVGIYLRKEYGTSKLEYPLIFEKDRKSFNTFALRASGSDWGNTMFRDGMIQRSTMGYTGLDNSGFRACVVYINGEYMGIHNIREKIDEDFIVGNHGLKGGTFDMVEETDAGPVPETGDRIAYDKLFSLAAKDLTNQTNWDAVANEMDIDNFTNLVCTEVYSGNSSIGHNLMAWKPKDTGKWKWILMDFDRGFFGAQNQLINFYVSESGWPLGQLIKNLAYKKQFGLKLADHLFTTFNPARIDSLIEQHKKTIETEIPDHVKKWTGTHGIGNYSTIYAISSVDYWLAEVQKLKTFAAARPGVLLTDLTKYGFNSSLSVSVSTYPAKAGNLTFNGLKIPVSVCNGGYPAGENIKLVAEAKSGYNFLGWKANASNQIIAKESDWKYSDTGSDFGTLWKSTSFSDAAWKTGKAELGYGDGDEKTIIGYGTNSNSKYITTYFRKNFTISNLESLKDFTILLKCDDGGVVYINGNEVARQNLPSGTIDKNTLALTGISGSDESLFTSYAVANSLFVNGQNTIAVEIHQNAAGSSDLSFDLELNADGTGVTSFLTTSKELLVNNLQTALNVTAVFEGDGKCILPAEISSPVTISKDCSPYVVPENVNITSSGKLTIERGVEIWMSDGVSINSAGTMLINGTQAEPVVFRSNPQSSAKKWGNISINNVSDTCRFKNVYIRDASKGMNADHDIFALDVFQSNILLDSLFIDNVYFNPLALYNSSSRLTHSRLHTNYDGADMLNVKYGKILIENCDFPGNNKLDVDAIDFGEMTAGSTVVRNCFFHDFEGFNSDAVDLGDHAKNVIIDRIVAYNLQDKGVSIGQQSTTKISNSVFLNCGMGAGMKDSSNVSIDHCTYYGNVYAIANYQKHAGDAGANAVVTNSILSNSYESGYLSDEYSSISISNSSDDTEQLPAGKNNLFTNPLFVNPTFYDFSLTSGSPLIGAGTSGNIGANIQLPNIAPSVMISDIAYFTQQGAEDLEFIGLYNPGNSSVALDSCLFTKGIEFLFPEGISIGPKEKIYLSSNSASAFWANRGAIVYQWTAGRLADEGETVQLVNKYGKVIDQVIYNNKAPWPVPGTSDVAISLISTDVDNHFGENWKLLAIDQIVSNKHLTATNEIVVYPNPASGKITISASGNSSQNAEIISSLGQTVRQFRLDEKGKTTLDVSDLSRGIYLLKVGANSSKILISR
jgi:hypothetical protein